MDAPPADLPDVAQAPPEKVVAYLRYLNGFFYDVHAPGLKQIKNPYFY